MFPLGVPFYKSFPGRKAIRGTTFVFLLLVALGSEVLRSSVCRWLLAVPAKATYRAMQSLTDPAKAPWSSKGKSKWTQLSSKWTAKFILDSGSPEAVSWVQEQEHAMGGLAAKFAAFASVLEGLRNL